MNVELNDTSENIKVMESALSKEKNVDQSRLQFVEGK